MAIEGYATLQTHFHYLTEALASAAGAILHFGLRIATLIDWVDWAVLLLVVSPRACLAFEPSAVVLALRVRTLSSPWNRHRPSSHLECLKAYQRVVDRNSSISREGMVAVGCVCRPTQSVSAESVCKYLNTVRTLRKATNCESLVFVSRLVKRSQPLYSRVCIR